MEPRELRVGDVVQIAPDVPHFGGCLMFVSEPKSFGAQVGMRLPSTNGRWEETYLRPTFAQMEFVGEAVFMPEHTRASAEAAREGGG